MERTIWIGMVEVRQLPVKEPAIVLSGKGAFVWVACWAPDAAGFSSRVAKALEGYGLFVVGCEDVQPADATDLTKEMEEIVDRLSVDPKSCIFGTFHNYLRDE